MKMPRGRVAAILAALAALAVAAFVILRPAESESAPPRGGGGGPDEPAPVETYVARAEPIQDRISATGTLLANEEVELVGETSGRITRVLFREGSPVRAGQLLVKVNDAELQADLESVRRRLALAELTLGRQNRLLEMGGVSREEFDLTQNEVDVLRAELQRIQAQIAKTEVRAPFGGTIGLREVSEGSYLSPQQRIATLQDLDPIKVEFDIPERSQGQVRVGSPVTFRVEGSDGEYEATVYALAQEIDPNTRTLRVRAQGSNPERTLRPGSFARVELIQREIPDALLVPTSALIPSAKQTTVFLVRDGLALSQPVQTGIRTEERVQITSGVAAGDTVVTAGLQQLRPGQPVQPTPERGLTPSAVEPERPVGEGGDTIRGGER